MQRAQARRAEGRHVSPEVGGNKGQMRLAAEANRIVGLLGGGLASSISPEVNGARISPIREGVGVNCGALIALAERLGLGVTGT
jgi:hypothetical protein